MTLEELKEHLTLLVEERGENQSVVSSIKKLIPYIWTLFGGAFAIGGWVATLEFRQHVASEVLHKHDYKIEDFGTWKIKTEANRFTSQDASVMVTGLMNSVANLDKRLQRQEDSADVIKESLKRIETKLP